MSDPAMDAWNRHAKADPNTGDRRIDHQGVCNVLSELRLLTNPNDPNAVRISHLYQRVLF